MSDFKKWWGLSEIFCGDGGMEAAESAWDHQQKRIDELESSLSIAEKLLSDESYQFYIEQVTKLKVIE